MINVCCRVRPVLNTDKGSDCVQLDYDKETVTLTQKFPYTFKFDKVFDCQASYDDVFYQCIPILENVISGTNGTIFAYGATCCGKTYTLAGPDYINSYRGIISRSVEWIFHELAQRQSQSNRYRISVSFLEIYLERVRDLLNPSSQNLQLCDGEAIVPDAFEIQVTSVTQLIDIIYKANLLKVMAPNKVNQQSSRSHCVIQLFVTQKTMQGERKSILFLADLAGSEKVNKTEAQGLRLNEARNINKSLLALGKVVNALVTRLPNAHIPYRDSKLTRILQSSLGGNCKTLIIVHLAPTDEYISENLYTLLFAYRAKFVHNVVQENYFIKSGNQQSPYAANSELLRMRELIKRLWFQEKIDRAEVDYYIKRINDEQFLNYAWTQNNFNEGEMRRIYEVYYTSVPLLSVVGSQSGENAADSPKGEGKDTAVQTDCSEKTAISEDKLSALQREAALLHTIIEPTRINLSQKVFSDDVFVFDAFLEKMCFSGTWMQQIASSCTDEQLGTILVYSIKHGLYDVAEQAVQVLGDCSEHDENGALPLEHLLESSCMYATRSNAFLQLLRKVAEGTGELLSDARFYELALRQPVTLEFKQRIVEELHDLGVPAYTASFSVFQSAYLATEPAILGFLLQICEIADYKALESAKLGVAFFEAIKSFSGALHVYIYSRHADRLLSYRLSGSSCALYALYAGNYDAFRYLCDADSKLLTADALRLIFELNAQPLMLYSLQFSADFQEAAEICALNGENDIFQIICDKFELRFSPEFLGQAIAKEVSQDIISIIEKRVANPVEAQIVATVESGNELPKELYGRADLLTYVFRGLPLAEYLYLKASCEHARLIAKFLAGTNRSAVGAFKGTMQRVYAVAKAERNKEWVQWCKELAVD